MGNNSSQSKPRLKNQTPRIQISNKVNTIYSEGIADGTSSASKTVIIQLIKLNLSLLSQIGKNVSVEARFQEYHYMVYHNNQYLGTIPNNYTSMLQPSLQLHGYVVNLSLDPAFISISLNIN